MNEEKQGNNDAPPAGGAASDTIQFIRRQVLAVQQDAQQCVENAVAGARRIVESRMSAFEDTLAQAEQLADQNQKEVERAFQQARDAVKRTFEQFTNPSPPRNPDGA